MGSEMNPGPAHLFRPDGLSTGDPRDRPPDRSHVIDRQGQGHPPVLDPLFDPEGLVGEVDEGDDGRGEEQKGIVAQDVTGLRARESVRVEGEGEKVEKGWEGEEAVEVECEVGSGHGRRRCPKVRLEAWDFVMRITGHFV
jgi:hypothetical protein